jgi:hypothetical protein
MLWRYLPFWDDTVDVFTVCDMDEIPSYTKRYGIQLWEETDKLFHTVQTWKSPSYVPGGGKISGRGGALIGKYSSDVLTYLASSEHFTYNDDQLWLARISSSVLKDSRLVHYILPLEPMSEDAVPLKIVPASKGGLLDVNRDFYLSLAGGHSHFIPEELALLDQQTSVESLE